MKKIVMLLLAPVYILLIAGFSCNSRSSDTTKQVGKAYFWKKTDPGITHFLFVNNTEKGILPFLPDSLTYPGSDIVQKHGLALTLNSGDYAIIAKDIHGNILCEGSLYLGMKEGSKNINSWKNDSFGVEVIFNN